VLEDDRLNDERLQREAAPDEQRVVAHLILDLLSGLHD
jgi:hypothetical protein